MEDTTRKADWTRRDAFHTAVLERDVAGGAPSYLRPSTRGTRSHKQTIWYPLKWIGINLILIAALAVLYTQVLIPHLQAYWNQRSIANVPPAAATPAAVRSMDSGSAGGWLPAPTDPNAVTKVERRRRDGHAPPDVYSAAAAAQLGYRCVGTQAFKPRQIGDLTMLEPDPNIRCE